MVRQRSAKPSFPGSNPGVTSKKQQARFVLAVFCASFVGAALMAARGSIGDRSLRTAFFRCTVGRHALMPPLMAVAILASLPPRATRHGSIGDRPLQAAIFRRTCRGGLYIRPWGSRDFQKPSAKRDCGNTSQSWRFSPCQLPSRGALGFCAVSSLPLRGGGARSATD